MLTLVGCEVERTPSILTPLASDEDVTLVAIRTSRDYPAFRTVFSVGSQWELIGRTSKGEVYRPLGGGLNVTGVNSYEAYAVVNGGYLIGYWMPHDQSFVGEDPIEIRFSR